MNDPKKEFDRVTRQVAEATVANAEAEPKKWQGDGFHQKKVAFIPQPESPNEISLLAGWIIGGDGGKFYQIEPTRVHAAQALCELWLAEDKPAAEALCELWQAKNKAKA